jgi:hypothetical protein
MTKQLVIGGHSRAALAVAPMLQHKLLCGWSRRFA